MGVPGFNTWMRSQYLGAYVPQRTEFDHVYVDMASILHTVLRKGAQRLRLLELPCAAAKDG